MKKKKRNVTEEGIDMSASEIEAKLRESLKRLRLKPAVKRHKKVHFAVVVKVVYEDIAELHKLSYSFDAIFDHLVEDGLLPADGDPKSLRQAFKREERRRHELKESGNPNHDTKKVGPKPVQPPAPPSPVPPERKVNELQKKINLGTTSETGLGRMTKNSDGTFEFDYTE